jgi:hypothetical protein
MKWTPKDRFDLRRIIRARGDILPSYRLVFDAALDYLNLSTGECYPSWHTLAKDTALSYSTVRRCLWWLHDYGVILLSEREGKTYQIIFRHPAHSYEQSTLSTAMNTVGNGDPAQMEGGPCSQLRTRTVSTAMNTEHVRKNITTS